MLEAGLLAHLAALVAGGVVDRERQRVGGGQHLDAGLAGQRDDLDLAGREVGVLVAGLAGHDLTGDLEAVLAAQAVRDRLVADDHLHHAAGLAEVQERDSTVIAPPRHPPGERDGLADVLGAQGAGVMGADHWFSSMSLVVVRAVLLMVGRTSAAGGVQVDGSASTCSPLRMSLTWWRSSSVLASAWTNQT